MRERRRENDRNFHSMLTKKPQLHYELIVEWPYGRTSTSAVLVVRLWSVSSFLSRRSFSSVSKNRVPWPIKFEFCRACCEFQVVAGGRVCGVKLRSRPQRIRAELIVDVNNLH